MPPHNQAGIEKATKKPWSDWVSFLNDAGAAELPHRDIADIAYAALVNFDGNRGWYAQSIAVAYEQHIGRRKAGQNAQGQYSVSVSRTLHMNLDDAFDRWLLATAHLKEEVSFAEPSISRTEKWRYWRAEISDGTRLVISVSEPKPQAAHITITHERLPSIEDRQHSKAQWKRFISTIS